MACLGSGSIFFSKEPKNPSPIWSHIFIAQPITTTYPNNLLGKLSQIGADVSAILASLQKRGRINQIPAYIDTIWIISANGG